MSAALTAAGVPLHVVGRPPFLVGVLDVANDTDRRVSLGRHEQSLRAEDGAVVRARLHFVGRAHPNARTRVPVHLFVDAATPPGLYRTEVDVGGTRHPVEVRVLPSQGVDVTPNVVRMHAAAGAPIESELVAYNCGNVEHVLAKHAVVFFEESHWVGRALVFALREADPSEGAQRYLDRVLHELLTTMGPTTTLHLDAPVPTLPPGAATVVRLSATLPAELAKGRTYVATFALAGSDVRIEIDVNGAANSTKRRPE